MRKHWLRLGALCLAVLMILPMTACTGGEDGGKNKGTAQALDGETPRDLGGYEFVVYDYFTTRWEPEAGTARNDTILKIIEDVENLYNCDIQFNELNVNEVLTKVQPEVLAGQKFADLVIATQWAYGPLLGAGLMGDLNKVEGLDLSKEWWNQNFLKTMTINGKILAGAGSFTSHTYLTWSCYFNKDIWQELKLPDPYQMVRDGTWTYKKFAEYAKMAKLDKDGSGKVDSESDRWGVVAPDGDYSRAAFLAMGGHFYSADETGKPVLAANSNHAFEIVEFMRNMTVQDGSYGKVLSAGKAFSDIIGAFVDGKSLFICCSPGESALKDMKSDFGILPQPKWDEEQESYIGMVDHNAPVFGITSTNSEGMSKMGYIMDALARRYQEVEELELQDWADTVWRDDESDEMVKTYIFHHGGYDLATIAQNANDQLGVPMGTVNNAMFGSIVDYPSTMEAVEPFLQAALDEFIAGTEQAHDPNATTQAADVAE